MHEFPFDELLSAYFDGEVTAEEREQVERLLETSAEARRRLNEFVLLSDYVRELPRSSAPQELAPAVHLRTERELLLGQNGSALGGSNSEESIADGLSPDGSAASERGSSIVAEKPAIGAGMAACAAASLRANDSPLSAEPMMRQGRKWAAVISLAASVAAVGLTTWLLTRSGTSMSEPWRSAGGGVVDVHDSYERTAEGLAFSPPSEPSPAASLEREAAERQSGVTGMKKGGPGTNEDNPIRLGPSGFADLTAENGRRDGTSRRNVGDALRMSPDGAAFRNDERRLKGVADRSPESEMLAGSRRKSADSSPAAGWSGDSGRSESQRPSSQPGAPSRTNTLAEKQGRAFSEGEDDKAGNSSVLRGAGSAPGNALAGKLHPRSAAASSTSGGSAPGTAPLPARTPAAPSASAGGSSAGEWEDSGTARASNKDVPFGVDSEQLLNERGVIIGGGLNDRMRTLGEAIHYFDTSGEKVVVIEMVVVDYWRAVDQFQYLLARNSIVDLKNGEFNKVSPADLDSDSRPADEGRFGGMGSGGGRGSDKSADSDGRRNGDLAARRGTHDPDTVTLKDRAAVKGPVPAKEIRKQLGWNDAAAGFKNVLKGDPDAGLLAVYAECNQENLANSIRDLVGQGYLVDAQLRPPMILADAEESVAALNLQKTLKNESLKRDSDEAEGARKKAAASLGVRQDAKSQAEKPAGSTLKAASTSKSADAVRGNVATVPSNPLSNGSQSSNVQNSTTIHNYGTEEQREALVSQLLENGLQRSSVRRGYSLRSPRGSEILAESEAEDVAVAELPMDVETRNRMSEKAQESSNVAARAASDPSPPATRPLMPDAAPAASPNARPEVKAKEAALPQGLHPSKAIAAETAKNFARDGESSLAESVEGSVAAPFDVSRLDSYQLRVVLPLPEDSALQSQANLAVDGAEASPPRGGGMGGGLGAGQRTQKSDSRKDDLNRAEPGNVSSYDNNPAYKAGESRMAGTAVEKRGPDQSAPAKPAAGSEPTPSNRSIPGGEVAAKRTTESTERTEVVAPASPEGKPAKTNSSLAEKKALADRQPEFGRGGAGQIRKQEQIRQANETGDAVAEGLGRETLQSQSAVQSGGSLRVLFVFRPQPAEAAADAPDATSQPQPAGRQLPRQSAGPQSALPVAPPAGNRPGSK